VEPLLFFKPPSCLEANGSQVSLPRGYARIDMEAELVVVIGKRARKVASADAWDHIFGLTLGNDVSCRDLQKRDGQWTRAKGFDGFGPVGPFIYRTPPNGVSTEGLRIRGRLDGHVVQDASVSDMIFPIPTLIEFISACMTLEPGDIIFTGTPAGVSALTPGSVTRIELEGLPLGVLETRFS
jgi:2-keto-4-pentenoate hydratase/2-oxohepta-3-ene-1,7-dioic acid hydratase in catechol pathway